MAAVDDEFEAADDDWDDWNEPPQQMPATSLFDQFTGSVAEVLKHMLETHGFDFQGFRKQNGIDQYATIKLINFIRKQVKDTPAVGTATPYAPPKPDQYASDDFLIPVLEDDILIQHVIMGGADDTDNAGADAGPTGQDAKDAEIEALRADLGQVRQAFTDLVASTESLTLGGVTASELRDDAARVAKEKADAGADEDDEDVEGYFKGYAHYGIHEEMLKDKVRTESYRDSMYNNKDYFKGKVVLDVGCGTGILSMMAARAGAAKVIGVDNSSVLNTARAVVEENNMQDVVTLIRGKIEEVELPVEKVDIIISEWMGYFLYFESMLDSVIFAREKWLKPGGLVLPDKCSLHLVALTDADRHASRIEFWDDVYGFKMPMIKKEIYKDADVAVVNPDVMCSSAYTLKETNCIETSVADVSAFESPFELTVNKAGVCSVLCVYFDINFETNLSAPVFFSTGPAATPTHWKQTLFYLKQPLTVADGDVISGNLVASKNTTFERHWEVTITYKAGSEMDAITQVYRV